MLLLLLAATARGHVPEVFITTADEDWCALIESVAGGDYVLLEPGDYQGPCDVVSKVSDPPGEVTIVQSLDPTQPARMLHDGASPYILSLAGDVGLLLDLDFGEVPDGVVAVELREGANLGVRNARFGGPGTAVRQVADIDIVGLRDCHYVGATGVALDTGCDGVCVPGTVEISNNLIEGGSPRFLVHAASVDVVDNTAIDVDPSPTGEGALLQLTVGGGSVTANTLDAGFPLAVEGPAVVSNNLLFGEVSIDGGPFVGNTLVGALTMQSGEQDHNALVGAAPGPTDVACDEDCFVDLEARDLYPAAAGPLVQGVEGPALEQDWCGRDRVTAPAVGAFAFHGAGASPGPATAQFKSRVDCRLPEVPQPIETGDTGASSGEAPKEASSCGCAAGPSASPWSGWTALDSGLTLLRRRAPTVR